MFLFPFRKFKQIECWAMAGDFHLCIGDRTNNLPPICDQGENAILHVHFHSTKKNDYELSYEDVENTLLTEFLKERFGSEFHENIVKLTFDITPTKDMEDFCRKVFDRGIYWNQRLFLFLGHSETQLKKKCCYLLNASHEEIHQMLQKFGDFAREENVAKRARKIGMLFSPLNKTCPLPTTQYRVEPDIKRGILKSYTFTQGCGFMSPEFSSEVQKTLKLDYRPSAVQIRYRGIEGMLVLKEDMNDVKVQFHNSMQKFSTHQEENIPNTLDFLDLMKYSRPYENGYLDTQMVLLLAEKEVPLTNFEKLQTGYYGLLDDMCDEAAEYFLRFLGEFSLLREIKAVGIDGQMKERMKTLKNEELQAMKKAAGQTRILVPQSRLVFAVCDPYNKLKYGECYFNPTMPDDEAKSFPGADRRFVVMRSPSYHPGDVRVFRLTDDKRGYENLRDCLVLPVKGPRPQAFECAGGTLGGDKFFVSWNQNIIPRAVEKPCHYPLKKSPGIKKFMANLAFHVLRSVCTNPDGRNAEKVRKEMQVYFATFSDDLPARIDATYMKYAAVHGPSSKECRTLSKLFHQAVNLMEDTAALEKKLLKFEEEEASSRSFQDSSNEGNPGNANEVRKKIEANAIKFIQRAQRKFHKSRA